jgi:hypothetical protein
MFNQLSLICVPRRRAVYGSSIQRKLNTYVVGYSRSIARAFEWKVDGVGLKTERRPSKIANANKPSPRSLRFSFLLFEKELNHQRQQDKL